MSVSRSQLLAIFATNLRPRQIRLCPRHFQLLARATRHDPPKYRHYSECTKLRDNQATSAASLSAEARLDSVDDTKKGLDHKNEDVQVLEGASVPGEASIDSIDDAQKELDSHDNDHKTDPDGPIPTTTPHAPDQSGRDPDEDHFMNRPRQADPIAVFKQYMRYNVNTLAIVTTLAGRSNESIERSAIDRIQAATVSSFNTVSMHPVPLISFNLRADSRTLQNIRELGTFSLTFLTPDRFGVHLAQTFAKPQENLLDCSMGKYSIAPRTILEINASKSPEAEELKDADEPPAIRMYKKRHSYFATYGMNFAYLCKYKDSFPAGDHFIVLAEVMPDRIRENHRFHEHGPNSSMPQNLAYVDGKYVDQAGNNLQREIPSQAVAFQQARSAEASVDSIPSETDSLDVFGSSSVSDLASTSSTTKTDTVVDQSDKDETRQELEQTSSQFDILVARKAVESQGMLLKEAAILRPKLDALEARSKHPASDADVSVIKKKLQVVEAALLRHKQALAEKNRAASRQEYDIEVWQERYVASSTKIAKLQIQQMAQKNGFKGYTQATGYHIPHSNAALNKEIKRRHTILDTLYAIFRDLPQNDARFHEEDLRVDSRQDTENPEVPKDHAKESSDATEPPPLKEGLIRKLLFPSDREINSNRRITSSVDADLAAMHRAQTASRQQAEEDLEDDEKIRPVVSASAGSLAEDKVLQEQQVDLSGDNNAMPAIKHHEGDEIPEYDPIHLPGTQSKSRRPQPVKTTVVENPNA